MSDMFTGIVAAVGRIDAVRDAGGDVEIEIDCGVLGLDDVRVGDSIAVNGCCLTVARLAARAFAADVSNETLSVTTLGSLAPGAAVNLEKALRAGDPLGGHYVTGHVDGIGRITERRDDARSVRIGIEVGPALGRYLARKGSVCVDGVSLTINAVAAHSFEVNLVPHTLAVTTLGGWAANTRVNVEVDILARYLERLGNDPCSGD
jgi:riboflavin synthase